MVFFHLVQNYVHQPANQLCPEERQLLLAWWAITNGFKLPLVCNASNSYRWDAHTSHTTQGWMGTYTWGFLLHLNIRRLLYKTLVIWIILFHGSHGSNLLWLGVVYLYNLCMLISLQHSTMAYLGLNGINLYMIHFGSDTDIHRWLNCCFIPFFLHCDSLQKQLHKTRREFDSFKILVLSPEDFQVDIIELGG